MSFSSCRLAGRWEKPAAGRSARILPRVPIGHNLFNVSASCADRDYVKCYGHALTLRYPWVLVPDGKRHQRTPADISSYTALGITPNARVGARLLCNNEDVHCGTARPFVDGSHEAKAGGASACQQLGPSLALIGVSSAGGGWARRDGARRTWMRQVAPRLPSSDLVACFVLSTRYGPNLMAKVRLESERERDILLVDAPETHMIITARTKHSGGKRLGRGLPTFKQFEFFKVISIGERRGAEVTPR
mgnify:CR=1 FL=1